MCPGENERYHNLMISHDGSVNRDLEYKDVCPVAELDSEPDYHHINIAYNNEPGVFHLDNETRTMTEYKTSSVLQSSKDYPSIPYSWEVLKIFIQHNNIVPNWIDCNYTWGWFDYETEKWTGAVGKVRFILLSQVNLSL